MCKGSFQGGPLPTLHCTCRGHVHVLRETYTCWEYVGLSKNVQLETGGIIRGKHAGENQISSESIFTNEMLYSLKVFSTQGF